MNKFSTVALLGALVAVGTPAAAQISVDPNAAQWTAMTAPGDFLNGSRPFWDNPSADNPTGGCNVGFVLSTGGAPACNGNTTNFLASGGQYFNNTATTFNFSSGLYEVQIISNIAGLKPPVQSLVAASGGGNQVLYNGGALPGAPFFINFGSSFWLEAVSFNPAGTVRSDQLFTDATTTVTEARSRWALFQNDAGTTFIGYEDAVPGDRDYNDLVMSIQYIGAFQVPEPASFALMGLGLVGLAVVSRRRKINS